MKATRYLAERCRSLMLDQVLHLFPDQNRIEERDRLSFLEMALVLDDLEPRGYRCGILCDEDFPAGLDRALGRVDVERTLPALDDLLCEEVSLAVRADVVHDENDVVEQRDQVASRVRRGHLRLL